MVVLDTVAATPANIHPRWMSALVLALSVLAVLYLGEGFYRALFGVMPQDLARRWLEGAYAVRHINAMDVYAGLHAVEPDLGPAHAGGYPPWSTALGLLIAPPIQKEWLRVYFAVLNAVALWFTARYAARYASGTPAARLFVVSCLAISANAVVLRHGQYGIIVNALLAGMLGALAAGNGPRGGLWLALAALKPQTSAPFALLWLRRRGVSALGVAALVGALGTLLFCLWVGTAPGRVFSQVFGQAANWDGGDAGPLRILLTLGVPRGIAIPVLAVGCVGAAAVLLFRFRGADPTIQAAIVCVSARLWTYHRRYDDMMLLFLLLPLGVAAGERPGRFAWGPFLAVGITLWLPLREVDHGPLLIFVKVATWVSALGWLLYGAAAKEAPEPRLRTP